MKQIEPSPKLYAIEAEREGVTKLIATLESFNGEFEFETLAEAIADAKLLAKSQHRKMLIIEARKFTNADYHGIGWVWPDGDYCEL